MRPQLQEAARAICAAGYRNVLVRGQMRLPCWFAAGAQLSEVAGFEVTSMQLGTLWSQQTPTMFSTSLPRSSTTWSPEPGLIWPSPWTRPP